MTCLATINTTLVNTQVTASVVWTDPKGMVISLTETRRKVTPPSGNNFTSTLIFLPIDIGRDHNDTGAYTCHMTINSPDSLIIPSEPNSTNISIIVESKPIIVVEVFHLSTYRFTTHEGLFFNIGFF